MRPHPKHIKKKQGFSLIEVVMTMGLLVFLIASVSMVFRTTYRAFSFNQDRAKSTSRISLGFQKMVDELQTSDGIQTCSSTTIAFSLSGAIYQYQITSNTLKRTDSSNRVQVIAENITTPGQGSANTNAFSCSEGTVTIDITSYNPDPAYSSTSSTNVAGHFVANVVLRGIPYKLVYWWKFDESSGTTFYDYGGRYPGKSAGNPGTGSGVSITTGVDNNALTFTAASSSYVGMTTFTTEVSSAYTVSLWVNPTSFSGYPGIFTRGKTDNGIFIGADALKFIDASGTTFTAAATISNSTWYHIAYVYNGTNILVYLNGTLKGTFASPNAAVLYARIGASSSTFFNGKIDDVRFYDVALAADDIAKLARYLPYYSSSTDKATDILTDTSNCGAIGTVCSGGTPSCVRGKCCGSTQINCSGTCVTAISDSSNCGCCGCACAGGKSCTNGFCCTTGLTNCVTSGLATCVDLQTDNNNCGSCGNVCTGGATCSSGICTAMAGGLVSD